MERDFKADLDRSIKARLAGKDMSVIRNELLGQGYSDEEVRMMVRMIDREQAKAMQGEEELSQATYLIGGGAVLFVLGCTITIATFMRAWDAGGGTYVIMYGAVLTGAAMFISGMARRRSKENLSDRKPFFREQRMRR